MQPEDLTNIGTFDHTGRVRFDLVTVSTPPTAARAFSGKLQDVLDHIRRNGTRNIRLSVLAGIAGVTPHHFSTLFTKATGLSPHQYLLRERIEHAKRYLEDEWRTVAEVSVLTGFQTQGHFSKVFRKLVGTTPSGFRDTLREKAGKDHAS